jgi:PAS domain S-box-containing protein
LLKAFVKRIVAAPEDVNLTALVRLASASVEISEHDREAAVATLAAQTLRYETALDSISQGVCFFDGEQRLVLSNRRYGEIYRLTPEQVRPGVTLSEIAQQRFKVGSCAMNPADYLKLCTQINSGTDSKIWASELKDGRTIHVCHQPMPDGGWVATHEDVTELLASRKLAGERLSLQALIDWVPDYLWVKDAESRFVVVNKALTADGGRAKTSDMIGLSDADIHGPEAAQEFLAVEQAILRSGRPMIDEEEFVVDGWGNDKWLSSTKVPLRNERNEIVGLVGIARDITARKRADALRDGQAQILEMIAMKASLADVLEPLIHLVESQMAGTFGAILLIDEDGVRLRHCAAPSMPEAFGKAGDAGPIDAKKGICEAAALQREAVIVKDMLCEPLCQDDREFAEAHGYRSCWANPILSRRGEVLGVLAMYSTSMRETTEFDARLLALASHIAGIAIELGRMDRG